MGVENTQVEGLAPAPQAEAPPAPVADAVPAPEGGSLVNDVPAAEPVPASEPTAAEAGEAVAPAEGEGDKSAVDASGDAPAEPAAEGEKPEGQIEAAPAEKPTYTEFKLPEGFKAAPEHLKAFTGFLAENNLSQEAGQKLMDLHTAALQETVKQTAQGQREQFDGMRRDWREDFFKSNGIRADTVANDAKWLIKELSPNADDRKALQQVLALTGAGDNKLVVGLLARAARKLREATPGPRPLPNNGRSGGTRADQRYGNQR